VTTIRVERKNNNKSRIDFIHNEIILVVDEQVIQEHNQEEIEQYMSRQIIALLEEEHNPISSLVQQTELGKELAFKKGIADAATLGTAGAFYKKALTNPFAAAATIITMGVNGAATWATHHDDAQKQPTIQEYEACYGKLAEQIPSIKNYVDKMKVGRFLTDPELKDLKTQVTSFMRKHPYDYFNTVARTINLQNPLRERAEQIRKQLESKRPIDPRKGRLPISQREVLAKAASPVVGAQLQNIRDAYMRRGGKLSAWGERAAVEIYNAIPGTMDVQTATTIITRIAKYMPKELISTLTKANVGAYFQNKANGNGGVLGTSVSIVPMNIPSMAVGSLCNLILGYDSYGKVVGAGESAAETIKAAATTLADAKKGPAAMSRLLSTINSETYATIKPILPESITTAIDQKGGIDSAQDLVKKTVNAKTILTKLNNINDKTYESVRDKIPIPIQKLVSKYGNVDVLKRKAFGAIIRNTSPKTAIKLIKYSTIK